MTNHKFPSPKDVDDVEEGAVFAPRFDSAGLIPAIAQDATSGKILMFAFMNAESLRLTMETGVAHYYSRSRKSLWKKGETSGQLQTVKRMTTDCDQDVITLEVEVAAEGAACHTGRASCFYRQVNSDGSLSIIDDEKRINPADVYGKKSRV